MNSLEMEVQEISEKYRQGLLSLDERNYLLQEIRDVRAAQECADNEVIFRYIVEACNIAMSMA